MRSSENHLKRARERLNAVHETIDGLERQLQDLRGAAVKAEADFVAATREYVEAQTAATIAKLSRE
jgi:predicted translin family RNA/ssDNA-binding protein